MSPRGFSVKCPSAPVPGARFFPGTLFIRRSGSVRILRQRVPPRSASSPVRPTRSALLSAMRLRPGLSEPSFLPPRPPRTFPFSCNDPPGIFPAPCGFPWAKHAPTDSLYGIFAPAGPALTGPVCSGRKRKRCIVYYTCRPARLRRWYVQGSESRARALRYSAPSPSNAMPGPYSASDTRI